jgi:hypothetical protein
VLTLDLLGISEEDWNQMPASVRAALMSKMMFPKANDINRFLAVSETVANLDLAVAEGKLRIERNGDVEIYAPATYSVNE